MSWHQYHISLLQGVFIVGSGRMDRGNALRVKASDRRNVRSMKYKGMFSRGSIIFLYIPHSLGPWFRILGIPPRNYLEKLVWLFEQWKLHHPQGGSGIRSLAAAKHQEAVGVVSVLWPLQSVLIRFNFEI